MSNGTATLEVRIVGNSSGGERAFQRTGTAAEGLGAKVGKVGASLGRAFLTVGSAVGGIAVGAGVMGVKVAAANEQAEISFTTMLGSAKKAGAFLKDLQAFAASTPFEFPELQTAASSLISAGINANRVIPIMKTLGDVTSGMGTGSEGVQRATIALQQMNAAGKITGEDLNQLRDAGIPVYDLLAAATGKSKAEIVKLAQAGKLGQKELGQMMKALESGKGLERFSGLMEKQSASLTGMWSTFKDTLGQGLAKAIEPVIPLLKEGLGAASAYLAGVLPKVAAGLKSLIDRFNEFRKGGGIEKLKEKLSQIGPWIEKLKNDAPKLTPVMQALGGVFKFAADHADELAKYLPYIVAGFLAIKAAQAANNTVGKNSVVGFWAEVAATGALAISNFALSGAIRGSTLATNQGMFATLRNTAAQVASAAKTAVVSAATKAWAAAQWLMNAALSANPIGLVVIAIAALVAGLIYAYKHSETFRAVVDTAFRGVANVAIWLWNNIMLPFIQWLLGGFAKLADGVGLFLRALSNIPGFGWAKTAADAMQTAADKARGLASNLHQIPSLVNIDIVLDYKLRGQAAAAQAANVRAGIKDIRGYAGGGTDIPAGLAWVGEEGPELMYVPGGSSVYDAETSKRMAQGGARRGGSTALGGSDAPTVAVYVTVQGSVTAERDLARAIAAPIRDELIKFGKRNNGNIFPK